MSMYNQCIINEYSDIIQKHQEFYGNTIDMDHF